jgi:enamine deaminase RidA (YjgF/YER057c/UK114 family)
MKYVLKAPGNSTITKSYLSMQDHGDDLKTVFQRFTENPEIVAAQFVFEGCDSKKVFSQFAHLPWPVMWIQGATLNGHGLRGTQGWFIEGVRIERVELDGRIVGSKWSDEEADYCMLAGVLPHDISQSRGDQARDVFIHIEEVLKDCGMSFLHVVRTWLYLDHLLDWYAEFNNMRTQFFRERGVFEHGVPASTGIGASNPFGSCIIAGAFAVRPKNAKVKITEVPSPLQCPAFNYKSSFSRAVELEFVNNRQLLISGTACIDSDGKTVHRDDAASQIEQTMNVIGAILESRGMTWNDTSRAIAYFKDISSVPLFNDWLRKNNIQDFPFVGMNSGICRDDLLFELELDAVAKIIPNMTQH